MKEKVIKTDFKNERYCVCRQVTAQEIAAVLENPVRARLFCEMASAQEAMIVSQLAHRLGVSEGVARHHLYVMEYYLIVNKTGGRPIAFTINEKVRNSVNKETVS
jgi:hypothetical protein